MALKYLWFRLYAISPVLCTNHYSSIHLNYLYGAILQSPVNQHCSSGDINGAAQWSRGYLNGSEISPVPFTVETMPI